jgi:hypothetical protein
MRSWLALALASCGFQPSAAVVDGPPVGSDASGPSVTSPRTLTVQLGNSVPLSSFPLVVELDSTRIDYAQIADPLTGFTFTDATSTVLDYDVDHWDPSGTSAIWVRVPTVAGGAPTTIQMAFGSDQHHADAFGVWGNYEQALHFEPSITDSSGTEFAPTPTGVTSTTGMIGSAATFANGSKIAFANGYELYKHWSACTLQFWIYADYSSIGVSVGTMDRGGPFSQGHIDPNSGSPTFSILWIFEGTQFKSLAVPMPLQLWTHVAYTWDGLTLIAYENGVAMTSYQPLGGAVSESLADDFDSFDSFFLGTVFQGSFDELELEQTAHPADWIPAEYKAQTDQAITFSASP